MKKYPYDTHRTCNLVVHRYLGFSAIFFRFRIKLHLHTIPSVNICEIFTTGLMPCDAACRLSWVGKGQTRTHSLMKILDNV